MATCHKCSKNVEGLAFTCKYCGLEFCGRHRLPEDHECEGLAMRKAQLKERLAKGEKLSYEPKVKRELKVKYDSDYEHEHPVVKDITAPLIKSPMAIIGMVVAVIVIVLLLFSFLR
ncbi:MAG: hypothetical protein KJ767_01725 [Nanoarchaeota archaeon]|nr:hypothetical protein [Nanoarchaeota archaeon]